MKDKWINLRCTKKERSDITLDAMRHRMAVSEYLRWLIDKQRKEDEGK
jgi:hypothetical protein